MAAVEMPHARFREHLQVWLQGWEMKLPLAPEYLGAIERSTLRIVSTLAAEPVQVSLTGRSLRITRLSAPVKPLEVSITLSAIRRGFAIPAFPEFTREQMVRNRAFYESAHA